jgi:hypothetical protein
MSNENQILIRVQAFLKYWGPQIIRILPDAAQVELNLLREVIDKQLEPKPEPPKVKKKPAKKKAKKVSKKK